MDISAICKIDGETVLLTQQGLAHSRQPIVTCNKKMLDQIAVLDSVSSTNLSVLVTGESGTIKERYTEYIHEKSKRATKPYLRFDCKATSEATYMMELFGTKNNGHKRPGILKAASSGTVLLDGISAIPSDAQKGLIEFIESGIIPGDRDKTPIFADVRFLSISNTDIISLISENKYSASLYGALSSVKIEILPLRKRPEDIALLSIIYANSANKKFGLHRSLGKNVFYAMLEYDWPGNEKQLIDLIERLLVMANSDIVNDSELFVNLAASYEDVREIPRNGLEYNIMLPEQKNLSLKDMVKKYELMIIRQSIKKHKTLRKAAKALKVAPSSLSRKLAAAESDTEDWRIDDS